MINSPDQTVRKLLAAWSVSDLDRTMDHIHQDCTHVVHVNCDAIPVAGRAEGHEAMREQLCLMIACFDYLLFRPIDVSSEGNMVRTRVEFGVRHKGSGQDFWGRLRLIIEVREGLVYSIEEFHDAPMLEAFMRFAESIEALKKDQA